MQSWVYGANDDALGLGLNHLPYTAFEAHSGRHLAVAIGACLLDLHTLAPTLEQGLGSEIAQALRAPALNPFMALGPDVWASLRVWLQTALATPNKDRAALEAALTPARDVLPTNPVDIRHYTDFYASIDHARRVGELFRPDQPLLPNYRYVPIAYHGRASSLVSSGTPIRRPWGQTRPPADGDGTPLFQPTQALDFELELGFYLGVSNQLGIPTPIADARARIFGVGLLNDWSARDIQSWEYQPLGPFLGKNFATTISAFVTPLAALEAARTAPFPRTAAEPPPLPYLDSARDQTSGALDLTAQASLRRLGHESVLTEANLRDLFWTPAQMIAHHTSGGCNLEVGDLLATGTLSGPSSMGCLLELTRNGAAPVLLAEGAEVRWLADGDEVVLRASFASPGAQTIRLGECRGVVLPAHASPK